MTEDLFQWGSRATRERDHGIAAVEATDERGVRWIDRALALLPDYPDSTATGEDIRLWLEPQIGAPHHLNATGAMIRRARKLGMLAPTGEWRKGTTAASHAREIKVYRIQ